MSVDDTTKGKNVNDKEDGAKNQPLWDTAGEQEPSALATSQWHVFTPVWEVGPEPLQGTAWKSNSVLEMLQDDDTVYHVKCCFHDNNSFECHNCLGKFK